MTRSIQSCGNVLFVMIACDFVCNKRCLSLMLSQYESSKQRFERVASFCFVVNFFWVSLGHNNILLLQYIMGPIVWRTLCLISRLSRFLAMCSALNMDVNWTNIFGGVQNNFQLGGSKTWPCISGSIICHLVHLDWLESTVISGKNSDTAVILFYCFFSSWSWASLCLWKWFFHLLRIWLWVSDIRFCNELTHLSLGLAKGHVVPFYSQISRLGFPNCICDTKLASLLKFFDE